MVSDDRIGGSGPLPELRGSEKQVEWANRERAAFMDPARHHPSIRHVADAMLPVVGSESHGFADAADWLPKGKANFPEMFRRRFGLEAGEKASRAYLTIENRLNSNAQLVARGRQPKTGLDETSTDDLTAAVGSRGKAEEIARAFGFTLSGGAA